MTLYERVHTFGSDGGLCGISSEAGGNSNVRKKTAVILLNAGLLHHVGQNRLTVNLARFLAQHEYYSFRFDLSGIGDSVTRRSGDSIEQRSVTEIREVIDYLQGSRGFQNFILFGLCTGADNAFRTAIADPRVCGVISLEGYAYPTKTYQLRRYALKLFKLSAWKNKISGIKSWTNQDENSVDQVQSDDVTYHWSLPPKDKTDQDLQTLLSRGVKLLMVYVGNNQRYNYSGQFADSFPMLDFKGKLREEYFSKSDHNFSMLSDRKMLFDIISEWLQEDRA